MKLHHLLFICGIALFIGGCKSATGPTDSTTIQQLFPLAYGNYWLLDAQAFDGNGNMMQDTTLTLEVFSTQTMNGRKVYLGDFGNGGSEMLYYSGSDLLQVSTDSFQVPSQQIVLRYPMNIGETLTIVDTSLIDFSITERLKFIGSNEVVTVPAGIFTCYHYQTTTITGDFGPTDSSIVESFFAPGIGLVEEKVYGNDSGKVKLGAIEKLTSYRVE